MDNSIILTKAEILAVAMVAVIYLAEILGSYDDKTLSRRQGKADMSFWRNWAVSIGLPIFAIINWLVIEPIVEAGHPWCVYPLCLALGYYGTRDEYRRWQKDREHNIGHIIDREGNITAPGWIHSLYMVCQWAVMILFIITPMDSFTVRVTAVLFIIFLLIQDSQSYFIQQNFNRKKMILRLVGAFAVLMLKQWLI